MTKKTFYSIVGFLIGLLIVKLVAAKLDQKWEKDKTIIGTEIQKDYDLLQKYAMKGTCNVYWRDPKNDVPYVMYSYTDKERSFVILDARQKPIPYTLLKTNCVSVDVEGWVNPGDTIYLLKHNLTKEMIILSQEFI